MPLSSEQEAEINQQRQQENVTKRNVVPALEEILYTAFPVLDHGFVRVVDYMGDDNAIVQAARVSYGVGTKQVNQDRGLIHYLMRHWHTTPFEMCEIKFHVKLPLFVARQWIRHRTANVNEYSARYSIMDKEFYMPAIEHIAAQSVKNHQGRDEAEPLSAEEAQQVLELLKQDSDQCYDNYQRLMNEDSNGNPIDESKSGIARELARMNLPTNIYTQWYWKIDLHNLMHFLMLRADSHAQYEIRAYADVMLDMVKQWVPHAYDAFMDYRMNAIHLSGKGREVIAKLAKGEPASFEDSGMSKREWNETMESVGLADLLV